jgi:macrolide-specific efflux system membrane fusion protein
MSALQLATTPPEQVPDAPAAEGRRFRAFWIGLIVVLLMASGFVAVRWQGAHADPFNGAQLIEARLGTVEDAVTALGKLQPRDYVDVGVQVSGQLMRLAVRAGDVVESGQLLAEIDPRLQVAKLELDRAQLAQLDAERAALQLQAEFSEAQVQRQKQLQQDSATRKDIVERTEHELRVARAKLASMDAQLRQVRSTIKADEAQLSFTRIFAPMAGTVVSIDARPGNTLIASQQVPVLMRIADLSSMTVWAQVSEADVTRLHPGMELYFQTLGHAERKWIAKLDRLLPAPPKLAGTAAASTNTSPTGSSVVLYTALFDVDNAAGELRPEMSAQIFFIAARAQDAVLIPAQSFRATPGQASTGKVTVATADGQLQERTVKAGVRNRFDVQIVEGLRVGERVVERTREEALDAVPK